MRNLGVFQAVQQHARLDHAYDELVPPRQVLEDDELVSHPPPPRLVRRNATASTISFAGIFDDIPVSSYPVRPVDPTDPSQPQTETSFKVTSPALTSLYPHFLESFRSTCQAPGTTTTDKPVMNARSMNGMTFSTGLSLSTSP